jgi:hypothetical protein
MASEFASCVGQGFGHNSATCLCRRKQRAIERSRSSLTCVSSAFIPLSCAAMLAAAIFASLLLRTPAISSLRLIREMVRLALKKRSQDRKAAKGMS